MKIAALLLGFLLPATAGAEPRVVERIRYYEVRAETAAEVINLITRIGPVDRNVQGSCSALTAWTINWRYRYKPAIGGCRISAVTTEAIITITMPRLESKSPELKKTFANFSQKLLLHERGHSRHPIEAAQKMEKAMASLAPGANCDVLQSEANAIGDAFVRAAQAQDSAYDAETDHGATQGVVVPGSRPGAGK